jgi:hypothetical protein
MKHIKICLILFLLIKPMLCISQNKNNNFTDAWFIVKLIDSTNVDSYNDFPFRIISFLPNGNGYYFPYGSINEYFDLHYSNLNDSLLLNILWKTQFKYKIIVKSDTNLILNKGKKYYYFKRLMKIENNNYITKDDTIRTFDVSPEFKGNLYELIKKRLPDVMYKDTSYFIEIEFLLKKDGSIDSVKTSSDSITKDTIKKILILTKKKWSIARAYGKKIDFKINYLIYIESKEMARRDIKIILNDLFNKGNNLGYSNNFDKSLKYFAECEKICDMFDLDETYSSTSSRLENKDFISTIGTIRTNSIINQATILDQMGKLEEACHEWGKIKFFDKEALENYKIKCK